MNDEEQLAQLYRDLCSYSIAKDSEGLSCVLDESYVLTHMTGMKQSGREYAEAVANGTLNYFATEHDSIDVQVAADGLSATICGRSRIDAAVFGGGRHSWRLKQNLTATKRDGIWKLTSSHVSTY